MIGDIIIAVAIVGALGLIFGLLLSFASVIFKVEVDERETKILEILPGANCGACGYAGCSAYASAIVNDGAMVSLCSVGKDKVSGQIAKIMGVAAGKSEPKIAKVLCGGSCSKSKDKYIYSGQQDCRAAQKLGGGQKECPNGCLGYGNCVRVCKFDAIMVVDGVAVVDENKCVGCGMCVSECPKNIIELVPAQNYVFALCKNTQKGALTNKVCEVGCIGCKKCEKSCPNDAITVIDNHAVIEYSRCINCGVCVIECPKNVIVSGDINE